MKTTIIRLAFICLLAGPILISCRSTKVNKVYRKPASKSTAHVPPGQAKKMYGDKSAKKYAPGQQKKK
ncbi:MAG TPA: hypothetical protein VLC28_02505 [Flavitalea sp.]|nr:hypothetical protein [Flavitalea sp.]